MRRWVGVLCIACLAACGASPAVTCVDKDGDSHCADGDCDDDDAAAFEMANVFVDNDGDTYGIGSAQAKCVGALAPRGFAFRSGDCDDNYTGCAEVCIDNDRDSIAQCAGDSDDNNPDCGRDATDNDADHHCVDHDCNDASALHWADCGKCQDGDSDGRGALCDMGADCNNADPNAWDTCTTCVDNDHDDAFTGCNAYITRTGPDCDDSTPVCLTDASCVDRDADGVRVCEGDCHDDLNTTCIARAAGGNSDVASGTQGGSVTLVANAAFFYDHRAPLPSGAFVGSLPSLSNALLRVRASDPPRLMTAAEVAGPWAGIEVDRGATLRLVGATGASFVMQTTDHVYIAGTIETTAANATLTVDTPTDASLDVTIAGDLALNGAPSADAAHVVIGASGHLFRNATLFGSVGLNGGDSGSGSGNGGSGGSLTVRCSGEIFANTAFDLNGGRGLVAGNAGQLTLIADTVRVRGDGIALTGGNGAEGGAMSLAAMTLVSSPAFFITANGGASAATGGNGGAIDITLSANATAVLPQCVASGGDTTGSSGASGGNGGSLTIAAPSGNVTVAAPLVADAGRAGASGGTIAVTSDSIQWNSPASAESMRLDVATFTMGATGSLTCEQSCAARTSTVLLPDATFVNARVDDADGNLDLSL